MRARHGTACKNAAQYIDATIQDRIDSDTTPLRRSGTGARVCGTGATLCSRAAGQFRPMVSVWRPLGGRSKRLVSVYVPPCESETFFTQILLADGSLDGHPKDRLPLRFCMFPAVCFHDRNAESLGADHRLYPASSTSGGADRGVNVAVDPRWRSISSAAGAALPRGLRETVTGIFVKESSRQA